MPDRAIRGGMSFTSFQFGIFVAVVFGAYYLPPLRRFQVQLLVLASLVFYGSGQPELLPLLLLAVLGTYLFLILAFRQPRGLDAGRDRLQSRAAGVLQIQVPVHRPRRVHPTGVAPLDFLLRLPLPIGISFFVFHNISLLVDLTRESSRRRCATCFSTSSSFRSSCPDRSPAPRSSCRRSRRSSSPTSTFVEAAQMDPDRLLLQALRRQQSQRDDVLYGLSRSTRPWQTPDRWLLVFLYSYQIYADFFGYSAIALGLGAAVRLSPAGQLQPALHLGLVLRVLDPLAHLAVDLAAGPISTSRSGGNRQRHGPDLPQPDDRDDARRALAWREPELRAVGHAARRCCSSIERPFLRAVRRSRRLRCESSAWAWCFSA